MMTAQLQLKEHLIEELRISPIELVKEVADYFEFLKFKTLKKEPDEFSQLSERAFEQIWNNEEDAVYDRFLQEV